MSALAGALLVARPTLRDSAFGRTVILLLQHGKEDGAFGLVLNRQAETNDLPFPIFVGGPCQLEGLLMLHGHADWAGESEKSGGEVVAGVYLGDSASFDRLTEMPEGAAWKFKVFAGYSGWAPQQLETEMSEGAWIVLPGCAEHVFETPADQLWDRLAPSTIPEPSLN